MKHFSKQLSWIFAFVLFFTSIVSGIPVYAYDIITIGEGTDKVIVDGANVQTPDSGYIYITYYESADSDTVLYEDTNSTDTIGSDEIALKPYAWHVTFVKKMEDNSGTSVPTRYYFKAYPDTALENLPVNTQMTLPEGATLTTTGAAIHVIVYVGDTALANYTAGSTVILPNASELRSIDSQNFDNALTTEGYNLPDLTKLYCYCSAVDKLI